MTDDSPSPPDAATPRDPRVLARADQGARVAWATLDLFGAIRPGMTPHMPLGALWHVGGVPMEVLRTALLDALGLPEDAPFSPRPDETMRATLLRWMDEAQGTPWEPQIWALHLA